MDFITSETIIQKENAGHVVSIYPRKHQVCIDGSKYYKVSSGTLNIYNYFKKTGFLVK